MKLYRNAGILILVLALLFGVYYYASNRKPEEQPQKDETIEIFNTKKDNIAEINIQTGEDNIAFVKSIEEVIEKDAENKEIKKEKTVWVLKTPNNPEINLIQSKIDSLAYDVANITAEQIVEENAQDVSPYGLEQPTSIVNVVLEDGGTKTFYVGDMTPSNTQYYFKEKESDTVYTIYSYKGDSLSSTLDMFRDRTIFTMNPEEVVGFTIEGDNRDKIVVQQKDQKADDQTGVLSTWDVIEPTNASGSNQNISEMVLAKIPEIQVQEFVEDNPQDLEKYGLGSPKYTISFKDKNKNTVTLLLGNTKDDMIYLKRADRKSVYLVKASSVEYRDIDPFKLMEKFAYIVNIDLVDKIVINQNNKQSVMEIIHNPNEEEDDSYKINGKEADESPFKKMYQEVIGLIVDGNVTDKYDGKIEGTPDVSYTFYHNNGAANVTMEYISIGDRYYAVVMNGKSEFYILKKKVDKMVQRLEEFEANPLEQED